MTKEREKKSKLSPKAFLKDRRPERFSDSVRQDVGRLDRAVLEHHLSTLNKRNKELDFEDFAKKLCEKVICPNLLEQTGPVAGGDGKVDTQTFPVSEQAKILWYVGVNDNANKDRWAFAVGTQEDWKAKCRKDVRKIKATDRNYKKAFCITNQYTKANQRSDIEDSLTKETGIDVRILDISWILDEIFKHGYEPLAIDTLSIDIDWRREIKIGANDYSKSCRIQQLQDDIKNEVNSSEIKPHQLGWFLEEAVLSKELEKPHIESQGLFERAIKTAERFGTSYHRFSAYYQYAWASYWWYEDMVLFEEKLQLCIEVAKDINQSGQWGDVVTLLGLYSSYCRSTKGEDLLDIESLRAETKSFLSEMTLQDERPSNSLMARVHIELLNLHAIENIGHASDIFSSLLSIVKESESLIGFSFQELYNLFSELDDIFGELESYEALLDYFTDQASSREGELQGSLLWLKRGARRLDSNKPYQAIKLIGKSLVGLYKEEAREDLYAALNILSEAYRKVGLLWASRANLLLAASMVTDEWWRSGDLVSAQVYSYIRLAKVELQLGRINYALAWWKFACVVDANLEEDIISERDFQGFDAYLSQCLLNSNFSDLNFLEKLPDLLDQYQLFVSRSMLLHALGYEKIVAEENEVDIDQDYLDYLKLVRDVDLGVITPEIIICEGRYIHLRTSVMGCEIKVSFPFRSPLVELAETILSVIEGFFSTSIVDQVMVFESRLDIEITADDDDEITISHELDDSGSILKMGVLCSSFTPDMLNIAGQGTIQKWLHAFVIEVFAHLMRPKNPEKTLESMLGDDRALERSVSFGACFVGLQNIMGDDAVKYIKSLIMDDQLKTYDLLRSEPWDKEFPKMETEGKRLMDCMPGDGEPPEDLIDSEKLTHRDMKVQDLIKIRLWDRTVWCGTGFAMYPDGTPGLSLLYEDEPAAIAIFDDLESEIGNEDRSNRLKVSIIRHIDKKSPAHYRVCISENFAFDTNKIVQMVARKNTMTPANSKNLDRFLAAYEKAESYMLSYAVVKNEQVLPPSSNNIKMIRKFDINVIEAWEIGPNDIEIMAIQKNDDPIIPDGVINPPIFESLKRKFSS